MKKSRSIDWIYRQCYKYRIVISSIYRYNENSYNVAGPFKR